VLVDLRKRLHPQQSKRAERCYTPLFAFNSSFTDRDRVLDKVQRIPLGACIICCLEEIVRKSISVLVSPLPIRYCGDSVVCSVGFSFSSQDI
jgi:hypothetical protein